MPTSDAAPEGHNCVCVRALQCSGLVYGWCFTKTWDLAGDRDVKQEEMESVNEAPPTLVSGFSLTVT